MKRRIIIAAAALLAIAASANAQEHNQALLDARDAFEMGEFSKVESCLDGKMETLNKQEQIQAFRLLSLSCIYEDNMRSAEEYASRLLALDPFYTAYGDSPRFSEILEKLKKGTSTVTTASKMAETVEEVPVPVTLITEDMIRASGAIKLQDILKLYVPGFSEISGMESNAAMRGVYGLAQETMLVMVDGHRLNSQATNAEPFDFRNSVDKIKQIEVLRGPASSLYGNVALTAVVNIITKSGSDIGGASISALGGKNKTYGGTFMLGKGNLQFDYLAWASILNSQGEEKMLSNTPHYIEGYNTKPTYDIGAKIKWGDTKVEFIAQHGHLVPYYNLLSLTDVYSYKQYGTVNGEGPGMMRTNLRGDAEWSHDWKNFSMSVSGFIAYERQQIYNVIGDTVPYQIMAYLAQLFGIQSVRTRGIREIINWEDYTLGASASGAYNYKFRGGMNGSMMLGFQFEDLQVGDAALMIGADFDQTNNVSHNILVDGSEATVSGFFQLKHYFTKNFILNGGIRYDYKKRIDGRSISNASPRISLIWMPSSVVTIKGGYSHAFVDAPAFYRGSTISIFSGGSNLNPEKMDSYQAGVIFNFKRTGLKYEANFFYNNVKDLVYYNVGGAGESGQTFVNAGIITMGGVENTVQYLSDRFVANANCTYQYPFTIENYASTENYLSNVPRFLYNTTLQYALISSTKGTKLWVRGSTHAQSGFNSLTNNLMEKIVDPGALKYYWQPSYAIFNAGIELKLNFGLNIAFDVSNIGNTQYDIGGQLTSGVPGLSRSYVFRAGFHF